MLHYGLTALAEHAIQLGIPYPELQDETGIEDLMSYLVGRRSILDLTVRQFEDLAIALQLGLDELRAFAE